MMKKNYFLCWFLGHTGKERESGYHICSRCGLHEYFHAEEYLKVSHPDDKYAYDKVWGRLWWLLELPWFADLLWRTIKIKLGIFPRVVDEFGHSWKEEWIENEKHEVYYAWMQIRWYWRNEIFGFYPRKCSDCGRRWRKHADDCLPF